MGKDVIIACDFNNGNEVLNFLSSFNDCKPYVKIGMELFYSEGSKFVKELKQRGYRVFLDLKLHDIPTTVKKTMKVLSELDVDMVNLHAAGAIEMMTAALEGLTRKDGTRPLLLAVTQLTSTNQRVLEEEILINKPIDEVVIQYAKNAKAAGLDGVVCSPLEATVVHKHCGREFLTVTPGIRFTDSQAQDQKRIMTPLDANINGSDYIVVGRPITASSNPVEAYKRCIDDFTKKAL